MIIATEGTEARCTFSVANTGRVVSAEYREAEGNYTGTREADVKRHLGAVTDGSNVTL